jgi:hypothetical protein
MAPLDFQLSDAGSKESLLIAIATGRSQEVSTCTREQTMRYAKKVGSFASLQPISKSGSTGVPADDVAKPPKKVHFKPQARQASWAKTNTQ